MLLAVPLPAAYKGVFGHTPAKSLFICCWFVPKGVENTSNFCYFRTINICCLSQRSLRKVKGRSAVWDAVNIWITPWGSLTVLVLPQKIPFPVVQGILLCLSISSPYTHFSAHNSNIIISSSSVYIVSLLLPHSLCTCNVLGHLSVLHKSFP